MWGIVGILGGDGFLMGCFVFGERVGVCLVG